MPRRGTRRVSSEQKKKTWNKNNKNKGLARLMSNERFKLTSLEIFDAEPDWDDEVPPRTCAALEAFWETAAWAWKFESQWC